MRQSNQISVLQLEILYLIMSTDFLRKIDSKGMKVRLIGKNIPADKKYNIIRMFKLNSPLFFNEYQDAQIRKALISIIKGTHNNNRLRNRIYKISIVDIRKFLITNKIDL